MQKGLQKQNRSYTVHEGRFADCDVRKTGSMVYPPMPLMKRGLEALYLYFVNESQNLLLFDITISEPQNVLLFNVIVTESLFVNEPQNPFHVIVTESLFVNEPQNPFLITVFVNVSLKMYSFMQKSSFYGT